MKIARRRATRVESPQAPPAPPGPPPGRAAVVTATILDGHLLWVAADARPGTPALRDTGTGDVLALRDLSGDDQPAYTAACLDLDELPWTDETSYDVVLTAPGVRTPRALWTAELPSVAPRYAHDERTLYTVRRGPDASLVVSRTTRPAPILLRSVRVEPERATIVLRGAGAHLSALGHDDEVVATWPVTDDEVLLSLDQLDAVEPQMLRLVCGEPGSWRPVRRRSAELLDPTEGAPMPQVFAETSSLPRARLRWSRKSELQLKLNQVDVPASGNGAAT